MSDLQEPSGSQPGSRTAEGNVPGQPKWAQGAQRKAANAEDVDATDAAANLAKDNNIDLSTVKGTGTDGRVLVSDVQAAIDARGT